MAAVETLQHVFGSAVVDVSIFPELLAEFKGHGLEDCDIDPVPLLEEFCAFLDHVMRATGAVDEQALRRLLR
jgi:hypothetical protein